MTSRKPDLSLEEVLEAFAIEQGRDEDVLGRYLGEYPQYAEDLIDLSHEIFRLGLLKDRVLNESDEMRIDSAWTALQASMRPALDPLANLSVEKLRELSQSLQLPRQVLLAFSERTVIPTSVPSAFIKRFANLLGASAQSMVQAFAQPQQSFARSYKADAKPSVPLDKISFEQVLREAGVPEEQIKQLIAEDA
jgi:hypothetical protein